MAVIFKYIIFITLQNCIMGQNITREAFTSFSSINVPIATKCLANLTREAFGRGRFITILNCNITKDPGYSIMAEFMRIQHKYAEITTRSFEITNGTRNTFQSFERCIRNCASKDHKKRIMKRHFSTILKSQIYIVFIDRLQDFEDNLHRIQKMVSYNMTAELFLIYTNIPENISLQAEELLRIAYNNAKYATKLLIPLAADVFRLYTYDLYAKQVKYCASHPILTLLSTCTQGTFNLKRYRYKYNFNRLNCTVPTTMMRFPPFVITPNDGLDARILSEVAKWLNVTFEIALHQTAGTWGTKLENGTWSGLLSIIFTNPFNIGVGAVSVNEDRLIDFDFSRDYFSESMLWIAPRAELVDEWKLILIIFRWTTWLALFMLMILICVLFWTASKIEDIITSGKSADKDLNSFSAAILLSLQVTLFASVPKQPQAVTNRLIFITYALFIIIIVCSYQSALIDVLTRPQYEHQISTYEEILETDVTIGGIADFKELFEESDVTLYNKYQIFPDDGTGYALTYVTEGKAISIAGEFFIKYKEGTPELTNNDGTSKIFVLINEVVYIDTFRIVLSKNFVLREQFDHIIDRLLVSGLVEQWTDYYINQYRSGLKQKDGSSGDIVLTLRHFEGSFFLLLVGSVCGLCAFAAELLVWKIQEKKRLYLIKRRWKKVILARKLLSR